MKSLKLIIAILLIGLSFTGFSQTEKTKAQLQEFTADSLQSGNKITSAKLKQLLNDVTESTVNKVDAETIQTLTISAEATTMDCSVSADAEVTLTSDVAITLTNIRNNMEGVVRTVQDATGGWGVTFASSGKTIHYIPGVIPTYDNINSNAGDINVFAFKVIGDTIEVSFSPVNNALELTDFTGADSVYVDTTGGKHNLSLVYGNWIYHYSPSDSTYIGPAFPISDANLISLWEMNEASGSTVSDDMGNHAGTATGTTVVSGKLNNARSFNGTSDYISASYINQIANDGMTSSFSIWTWVNVNTSESNGVIFQTSYNGSNTVTLASLNWKFVVQVDDGTSSSHKYLSYPTTSTTGAWHLVVITWNATTETVTLYVDGVSAGTVTSTITYYAASQGCRMGYSLNNDKYFQGIIDHTGIANYVLTQQNIDDLYLSGTGIEH